MAHFTLIAAARYGEIMEKLYFHFMDDVDFDETDDFFFVCEDGKCTQCGNLLHVSRSAEHRMTKDWRQKSA